MKIVIKTTNVKLTPVFEEYIREKINSLEKFAEEKGQCEAWVEVGRITRGQQKGKVFRAECQMRFPKDSLRAEAESEDLKLAITEVKDELQRELKQYKNRLSAQSKKGARAAKKELKLSPQARLYRKGRIREEGV